MSGGQAAVARATAAVFVDGRRAGSAVLVGPRYLVTAAHVLQRQDPRTLAKVAVEQVELEFPDQGPGGQPGTDGRGASRPGPGRCGGGRGRAGPGRGSAGLAARAGAGVAGRAAAGQGAGVRLPAGREARSTGCGGSSRWRARPPRGRCSWTGSVTSGTFPGHSGGPVIDADGHALAGILVEGAERGRFDRFVPVTLIARVWPGLPRPWLMTGAEPGEARSHFTRRARGQRSAARGGDLFRGRTCRPRPHPRVADRR